ncbi:MAG: hypothetical protein IPN05_19775 [Sulfuritalea sp.]|nr:hypothetical protein [Sulfuritalea sp.]
MSAAAPDEDVYLDKQHAEPQHLPAPAGGNPREPRGLERWRRSPASLTTIGTTTVSPTADLTIAEAATSPTPRAWALRRTATCQGDHHRRQRHHHHQRVATAGTVAQVPPPRPGW